MIKSEIKREESQVGLNSPEREQIRVKLKLYHGSTVAVRKPSLRPGRPNADFGKGFYTTSNYEQAVRWAHIKKEREDAERAVVSVYEFDETQLDHSGWNIRRFTGADEPWLLFVADCRKAASKREQRELAHFAEREQARPKVKSRPHNYDIVQGPVANDKVFTTVNLFESGVLSAEAAILQLKAYKTYDQLSFHTDQVIRALRFVQSIEV